MRSVGIRSRGKCEPVIIIVVHVAFRISIHRASCEMTVIHTESDQIYL